MDFIDKLRELATQIPKQVEHIRTEEATKSALVMPFINALGYNVFDPTEVTPEFVADVGIKKGEKVDYVILKNGEPLMMFECKAVSTDLDKVTPSQLYRYFSTTSECRFGILTNGIVYRVFSDLQEPNKMDAKPFLELNMLGIEEPTAEEFKRFTKPLFDARAIIASASDFRYTSEIKRILTQQLQVPSEDFVRFFANQLYEGRTTQSVKEQIAHCVKRAFSQFVNEQINARLKSALVPENGTEKPESTPAKTSIDVTNPVQPELDRSDRQVTTTAEELEAYYIVKAILRETVDAKRIVARDALSYCAIIFDDNNRRPICRLYFNSANKSVGFFNDQRQEEKLPIESIDDIYKHSDRLKKAVGLYLKQPETNQ
jgi:predicted type IV restriction endonuclease